ncbi:MULTISPECIES: IS3 family transposase [Mammaliicoccus]|uniref:IS3 family transposase n=5 Tax=Mammaliicoccus TaxID=2803850 RepID=A0A517CL88_MAMSC|nr:MULTISPECIES: IS3 family transposase [Mammaliicoccus]MBL0848473.1 IS3 family transposase [Mammaliicoccus fleurettii]MBS3673204.1 IS3 family transposase [Mammaliicoccus fleurettii]MBS3698284.1 IS3 family transposase [Mammaliicoccus fleurettii]QDR65775.1 IS3 family transposase [Mammaliicoccus sciuri]QDR66118.1 IS3 family transposase [Mammaliicoccus sciuri]
MKRVAYSVETKNKVIEMKIKECSTREIMDQLNIRSKTQVDNWWKWYRNGETHRFNQQIGKQYSYGKDKEELSSEEALKLKLKRLEIENDIFKKVQSIGKEVVPEIVVELVNELKNKYSVKLILETLNIPKSNYYRWKNKVSKIDEVEIKIKKICKDYKFTYGYRKVTALVNKAFKEAINHKKVQRIMQKYHLNCKVRMKKFKKPGSAYYRTSNLVNRNFRAEKPLQLLLTDITYLPFGKSMLYLSSIMDAYNGEIIAYKIGPHQNQKLVNDTLNQIEIPKDCVLHSDQGSVYTSYEYYKLCEEKGIIRSMSRKGTPADNAPIESFHSSLKCETFYLNSELNSSNDIVIDIVENYIKNYNKVRIQQKLGYLSPIEFRKLAA